MPECWNESRQNQPEMVQVVDYRMHCLVEAVSENQLHLAALKPQPACWWHQHLPRRNLNSPKNNKQQFLLTINVIATISILPSNFLYPT